jgi:rubrerythrin
MQKQCLNDNCYNIIKQLAKKQQFLAHVNRYIEDASKSSDTQAEKTWKTIQTDEQKHAEMLHDLLSTEVKNNKF